MGRKTGNGSFAVTVASGNTGSAAVSSATLSDRDAWDGGNYTVRFTAPDQYQIVDGANNVLQSGAAADGSTITFRGASLKFTGTAAAGDSFSITPSGAQDRSEEHTSELQSLMRISYAVFCLKNKKKISKSDTIL